MIRSKLLRGLGTAVAAVEGLAGTTTTVGPCPLTLVPPPPIQLEGRRRRWEGPLLPPGTAATSEALLALEMAVRIASSVDDGTRARVCPLFWRMSLTAADEDPAALTKGAGPVAGPPPMGAGARERGRVAPPGA
jgi:hypothetical protein